MYNTHENYGTYFGELKTIEEDEIVFYSPVGDREATEEFVEDLINLGVEEVLFDVEDLDDHSDTCFFKTGERTDWQNLMTFVAEKRPNEFSRESDNHFRMWFD